MINSKSYGLQNETRQYLRRLYSYGRELNLSDVADIDNFIKGLKQFNLWQSVVCWPIRSIHNIGSGSSILCFGGYRHVESFDGVSVNSPTWDLNGITFSNPTTNSSIQRIDINTKIPRTRINSFVFGCGSISTITNYNRYTDLQDGTANGYNPLLQHGGGRVDGCSFLMPNKTISSSPQVTITTASIVLNAFNTFCGSKQGNTIRATINGSITNTANAASGFSQPTTNNGTICAYYNGTISFVCLGSFDMSLDQVQTFNKLYKTTIGKGLGLP